DPSPSQLEGKLSEEWWQRNVWQICNRFCDEVSGCFIMVEEMTLDSTRSRNNKLHMETGTPQEIKMKTGARADFVWRSLCNPEKDWAIGEAAREWDPFSQEYVNKGDFKLPRQLHDILISRSIEVGGPSKLRDALISGLLFK
ncbi:hypothetical protein BX616_007014, partial [Lobosporangium transversale]